MKAQRQDRLALLPLLTIHCTRNSHPYIQSLWENLTAEVMLTLTCAWLQPFYQLIKYWHSDAARKLSQLLLGAVNHNTGSKYQLNAKKRSVVNNMNRIRCQIPFCSFQSQWTNAYIFDKLKWFPRCSVNFSYLTWCTCSLLSSENVLHRSHLKHIQSNTTYLYDRTIGVQNRLVLFNVTTGMHVHDTIVVDSNVGVFYAVVCHERSF